MRPCLQKKFSLDVYLFSRVREVVTQRYASKIFALNRSLRLNWIAIRDVCAGWTRNVFECNDSRRIANIIIRCGQVLWDYEHSWRKGELVLLVAKRANCQSMHRYTNNMIHAIRLDMQTYWPGAYRETQKGLGWDWGRGGGRILRKIYSFCEILKEMSPFTPMILTDGQNNL